MFKARPSTRYGIHSCAVCSMLTFSRHASISASSDWLLGFRWHSLIAQYLILSRIGRAIWTGRSWLRKGHSVIAWRKAWRANSTWKEEMNIHEERSRKSFDWSSGDNLYRRRIGDPLFAEIIDGVNDKGAAYDALNCKASKTFRTIMQSSISELHQLRIFIAEFSTLNAPISNSSFHSCLIARIAGILKIVIIVVPMICQFATDMISRTKIPIRLSPQSY